MPKWFPISFQRSPPKAQNTRDGSRSNSSGTWLASSYRNAADMQREPEWELAWSAKHKRWYYQDRVRGTSVWTRPEGCNLEIPTGPPSGLLETGEEEDVLLEGWEKSYDAIHKRTYYYNRNTAMSSWDKPGVLPPLPPPQELPPEQPDTAVEDLQRENTQLAKEALTSLRRENQRLQKGFNKAQLQEQEILQLKETLEGAQQELRTLYSKAQELDTARQQLENMRDHEEQLLQANSNLSSARAELEQLRPMASDLQSCKKELEELRKLSPALAEAEKQAEAKTAQMDLMQEAVMSLKRENQRLELDTVQLSSLRRENRNLEAELNELKEKADAWQKGISNLRRDKDEVATPYKDKKWLETTHEGSPDAKRNDGSKLEIRVAELDTLRQSLAENLRAREQEIAGLYETVGSLRNENSMLKLRLQSEEGNRPRPAPIQLPQTNSLALSDTITSFPNSLVGDAALAKCLSQEKLDRSDGADTLKDAPPYEDSDVQQAGQTSAQPLQETNDSKDIVQNRMRVQFEGEPQVSDAQETSPAVELELKRLHSENMQLRKDCAEVMFLRQENENLEQRNQDLLEEHHQEQAYLREEIRRLEQENDDMQELGKKQRQSAAADLWEQEMKVTRLHEDLLALRNESDSLRARDVGLATTQANSPTHQMEIKLPQAKEVALQPQQLEQDSEILRLQKEVRDLKEHALELVRQHEKDLQVWKDKARDLEQDDHKDDVAKLELQVDCLTKRNAELQEFVNDRANWAQQEHSRASEALRESELQVENFNEQKAEFNKLKEDALLAREEPGTSEEFELQIKNLSRLNEELTKAQEDDKRELEALREVVARLQNSTEVSTKTNKPDPGSQSEDRGKDLSRCRAASIVRGEEGQGASPHSVTQQSLATLELSPDSARQDADQSNPTLDEYSQHVPASGAHREAIEHGHPKVEVAIPHGLKPGQVFLANVHGVEKEIEVPDDCFSGDFLELEQTRSDHDTFQGKKLELESQVEDYETKLLEYKDAMLSLEKEVDYLRTENSNLRSKVRETPDPANPAQHSDNETPWDTLQEDDPSHEDGSTAAQDSSADDAAGTVEVVIPDGCEPGQTFIAEVYGVEMDVEVPDGCFPGDIILLEPPASSLEGVSAHSLTAESPAQGSVSKCAPAVLPHANAMKPVDGSDEHPQCEDIGALQNIIDELVREKEQMSARLEKLMGTLRKQGDGTALENCPRASASTDEKCDREPGDIISVEQDISDSKSQVPGSEKKLSDPDIETSYGQRGAEKSEGNDKVEQLVRENEQLLKENQELAHEADALRQQVHDAAHLNEQLKTSKIKMDALIKENKQLMSENSDLSLMNHESVARVESLQQLAESASVHEGQLTVYKTKVDELAKDNRQLTKENEELGRQKQELTAQADANKQSKLLLHQSKQLTTLKSKLDYLLQENEQLARDNSKLRLRPQTFEHEADSVQQLKELAATDHDELVASKTKIAQLINEKEQLVRELKASKTKIAQLINENEAPKSEAQDIAFVEVVIPDGHQPGQIFIASIDGDELEVEIPDGCVPGDVLKLAAPSQDPSADQPIKTQLSPRLADAEHSSQEARTEFVQPSALLNSIPSRPGEGEDDGLPQEPSTMSFGGPEDGVDSAPVIGSLDLSQQHTFADMVATGDEQRESAWPTSGLQSWPSLRQMPKKKKKDHDTMIPIHVDDSMTVRALQAALLSTQKEKEQLRKKIKALQKDNFRLELRVASAEKLAALEEAVLMLKKENNKLKKVALGAVHKTEKGEPPKPSETASGEAIDSHHQNPRTRHKEFGNAISSKWLEPRSSRRRGMREEAPAVSQSAEQPTADHKHSRREEGPKTNRTMTAEFEPGASTEQTSTNETGFADLSNCMSAPEGVSLPSLTMGTRPLSAARANSISVGKVRPQSASRKSSSTGNKVQRSCSAQSLHAKVATPSAADWRQREKIKEELATTGNVLHDASTKSASKLATAAAYAGAGLHANAVGWGASARAAEAAVNSKLTEEIEQNKDENEMAEVAKVLEAQLIKPLEEPLAPARSGTRTPNGALVLEEGKKDRGFIPADMFAGSQEEILSKDGEVEQPSDPDRNRHYTPESYAADDSLHNFFLQSYGSGKDLASCCPGFSILEETSDGSGPKMYKHSETGCIVIGFVLHLAPANAKPQDLQLLYRYGSLPAMRHFATGSLGCTEVLFEFLCESPDSGSSSPSGSAKGGFFASSSGPLKHKAACVNSEQLLCCMPLLVESRHCRQCGKQQDLALDLSRTIEQQGKDCCLVSVPNLEAAAARAVEATEQRLRGDIYHADGEGTPVRRKAHFLLCLGRTEESEFLWRRAFEEDRAKLGMHHVQTARSAASLAACLDDLGRAKESEPLYRQAKEAFASNHLQDDAAASDAAMAACLCAQGKTSSIGRPTKSARAIETRPAETCVAPLKGGPSQALKLILGRASSLANGGEHEEAEAYYRQALCILRRKLGNCHPDTLQCLNNLASCCGEQGRFHEAEQLLRITKAGLESTLGSRHPCPMQAMTNLACCVADQGRLGEAEDLHRQALVACRKNLGANHPETKACAESLASFLSSQGRSTEAALIVIQGDFVQAGTPRFHGGQRSRSTA